MNMSLTNYLKVSDVHSGGQFIMMDKKSELCNFPLPVPLKNNP